VRADGSRPYSEQISTEHNSSQKVARPRTTSILLRVLQTHRGFHTSRSTFVLYQF